MTIMASDTKRASIERKPEDNFIEMSADPMEKGGVLGEEADYSGAVKKSSPEEIALVRKLDFRIMPTLWAMYFLNYVRKVPCYTG
jgi:hypothetical protein